MSHNIRESAKSRGITRLCHFTPSRNLAHILTDGTGLLATKHLKEDERKVFNQTDLNRLDGYPDHVCCSIEYPNGWYFRKARAKEALFREWVVFLIDPHYLWEPETKFCPRNASSGYGRDVKSGDAAFGEIFVETVVGARRFTRSPQHLSCCPTDDQAEVLIPDAIPLEDILGIVVSSEAQAKQEFARLRLADLDPARLRWVVSPTFFQTRALSDSIRAGRRPTETLSVLGAHSGS